MSRQEPLKIHHVPFVMQSDHKDYYLNSFKHLISKQPKQSSNGC